MANCRPCGQAGQVLADPHPRRLGGDRLERPPDLLEAPRAWGRTVSIWLGDPRLEDQENRLGPRTTTRHRPLARPRPEREEAPKPSSPEYPTWINSRRVESRPHADGRRPIPAAPNPLYPVRPCRILLVPIPPNVTPASINSPASCRSSHLPTRTVIPRLGCLASPRTLYVSPTARCTFPRRVG